MTDPDSKAKVSVMKREIQELLNEGWNLVWTKPGCVGRVQHLRIESYITHPNDELTYTITFERVRKGFAPIRLDSN